MALNESSWKTALQTALEDIFTQMHSDDENEVKDDAWLAEQLADAIASTGTDQIKTAGIPIGSVVVSVTGQAVGASNVSEIKVA